jgi:hypothetical protein
MNILSRDKQIEIIAALSEGLSIRSVERLTGVHRDTIMRLGARVGRGCAELHDRMMVGLRVPRIEGDELWAYVGCKQKRVTRANVAVKGDQYTYVALAASRLANSGVPRPCGGRSPRRSSSSPRSGNRSAVGHFDQLRGAQQPFAADGIAAVYSAH